MVRDLWERAEAAIEETRRLVETRRHLLEEMTDIAVHRLIVAQDAGRRLHGAERRLVAANAPAVRAGLAGEPTTRSKEIGNAPRESSPPPPGPSCGTNRHRPACVLMGDTAERERVGAKDDGGAQPDPRPEEWEKLRLRFELELLESQDAGASLDPLLRRTAVPRRMRET